MIPANCSKWAALTMAANYRCDVKLFRIDEETHTAEVRMYDGRVLNVIVHWEDYTLDTCMCDILTQLIGEEPPVKGRRAPAALEQRQRWHHCKVCETVE